jgi:Flp pilus assembly CpaE family ATPase
MYLIYSDKVDEFARIKTILGASAKRVNTRNSLIASLEEEPATHVIVIAPSVKGEIAYSLAAELRIDRPLVNVILVRNKIDVQTLTASLESGIKDVIDSQDATALMNAVQRCENVSERIQSIANHEETERIRGRVITVYSAKGGCGKTTIATNLASVLTHDRDGDRDRRVCLLDLDLQFGDVGTSLRMNPTKTISQTLETDGPIDADRILENLLAYQGRFDVLLAPISPVDIERISSEFVSRLISTLQNHYDFIVIDTAPTLSEVMVRTLQESDLAILITTLDMSAIKNIKLTISALDALGLSSARRMLLLNHADLKVGIDSDDVEDLIGETIRVCIPSSTKVSLAANRGELIVDAYPSSAVSKAIQELAREVDRYLVDITEASVA